MIEGVLLVSLIASSSAAISLVIGTLFHGCRRSRCTHIQVCGSCMKCEREVMTTEELTIDTQQSIPIPSYPSQNPRHSREYGNQNML